MKNALLLKQVLNLGVFGKREKCTFAKTGDKFRCFSKNAHGPMAHGWAKYPYLRGAAHPPRLSQNFGRLLGNRSKFTGVPGYLWAGIQLAIHKVWFRLILAGTRRRRARRAGVQVRRRLAQGEQGDRARHDPVIPAVVSWVN